MAEGSSENTPGENIEAAITIVLALVLGIFLGSAMVPAESFIGWIGRLLGAVLMGIIAVLVAAVALFPLQLVLSKAGQPRAAAVVSGLSASAGIVVALAFMLGGTLSYFAAEAEWRAAPYAWLSETYPAIPEAGIAFRDWGDSVFGDGTASEPEEGLARKSDEAKLSGTAKAEAKPAAAASAGKVAAAPPPPQVDPEQAAKDAARQQCLSQMDAACENFRLCYDIESCNQRSEEMNDAAWCANKLGWNGDWASYPQRSYSYNDGQSEHVCYTQQQAERYVYWRQEQKENEKFDRCQAREKSVRKAHYCCVARDWRAFDGDIDEVCRRISHWDEFEQQCYRLGMDHKQYSCN